MTEVKAQAVAKQQHLQFKALLYICRLSFTPEMTPRIIPIFISMMFGLLE